MKIAKFNSKPEIFHSIQGEGKSIGTPSVFIRLSLCNLYCIWCDTDYTWNWKGTKFKHNKDNILGYDKFDKKNSIVNIKTNALINKITEIGCKNIVITGGEPMVQHKELLTFLSLLKEKHPSYRVEIETNGTITPNEHLDNLIDQYNVSIKLSNSNVKKTDRIITKAISFFANSPKSNFKFVVDQESDFQEILKIKSEFNLPHDSIYLMPQGTNADALNEKKLWLVEICKEYEFNYTDRLHIHIYRDKRGV